MDLFKKTVLGDMYKKKSGTIPGKDKFNFK